jgi:hypothetical protein
MAKEPQTLDDMMADYDKERLAEIDAWERNKPEWLKRKIEAERQRDIERGIRDADGNFILPDDAEAETEDEDEPDD